MKPTDKRAKRSRRSNQAGDGTAGAAPREGSKIATVIEMLRRANGASVEELTSATGWLPHTTRAALTGLRKRGLVVERTKEERRKRIATIYRIVGT
jgi:DNA-binding MarR family transcriptional regulator